MEPAKIKRGSIWNLQQDMPLKENREKGCDGMKKFQ
jgi:hypothetical protein